MKYISCDIENTGVDPNKDQILSIGMAIEDTNNLLSVEEIPKLHLVIDRERITGHPYALNMNKDLINLVRDYQLIETRKGKETFEKEHKVTFVNELQAVAKIFQFLYIHDMLNPRIKVKYHVLSSLHPNSLLPLSIVDNYPITTLTLAGKNVGTFDKLFLERLPRWNEVFRIHQRVLDPAMLFIDWKEDEVIPNTNTCLQRAGYDRTSQHDALEDCLDVIRLLRSNYDKLTT